jgi:hypothetical protein
MNHKHAREAEIYGLGPKNDGDYIVVSAYHPEMLAAHVNSMMRSGWEPHGALSVVLPWADAECFLFHQPMVKTRKMSEPRG